jgi:hypothetical protein
VKNRYGFSTRLTLLPVVLSFSLGMSVQPARDPQRDLSVTFSIQREGQDPGSVVGVVKNTSTNAYQCARIEFDLATRFDLRRAGEEASHLGILTVDVQGLQPQGERNYRQQLPFPAGIGLKSIGECPGPPDKALPDAPKIISLAIAPQRIRAGQAASLQWVTENTDAVFIGESNPEWPRTSEEAIRAPRSVQPSGSLQVDPSQTVTYRLEAKKGAKSVFHDVRIEVMSTCSITGRLEGPPGLHFETRDDRGQPLSVTLTRMRLTSITAPGDAPLTADIQLRERVGRRQFATYTFTNVAAGRTYKVFPGGFRAEPRERTVECRPNETHGEQNFRIIGPTSG